MNWQDHRACLVFGAYHSQKGKSEGYETISLGEIFNRTPLALPKESAEAIIPSSYADPDARSHASQCGHGSFVALVGDIDIGNHSNADINQRLTEFFGEGIASFIYSTSSASRENQKWRFIVPLETPLGHGEWLNLMSALYAFMSYRGILMDKKMLGAGQLCYLPNVPAERRNGGILTNAPLFYDSASTYGHGASALLGSAPGWLEKQKKEIDFQDTVEQSVIEFKKIAQTLKSRKGRESAIDKFNRSHSLADVLISFGYTQSPNSSENWRSIYQTSNSYATRTFVDKDGGEYWVSLSASDALKNIGAACKGGHRFGDAFDLLVHFQYNGDRDAALRDQPPDASRYRLYTAEEISQLPPISWLVRGVLPKEGLAAIYGASGSGKSFLALDLLGAIARGQPWFGNKTIPLPVTYVALEGESGISQRVQAYELRNGKLPLSVRFAAQPLNLLTSQDVVDLASAIRSVGGTGGVVCIDTLNRASSGADENDSKDMGRIIQSVKQLQYDIGGLVILVHHSGKDASRGLRGHSSLHASLDAAIEVTKIDQQRNWRITKSKDGRDDKLACFRLEVVELGTDAEGDAITSCVVIEDSEQSPAMKPLALSSRHAVDAYHNVEKRNEPMKIGAGISTDLWREEFYKIRVSDTKEAKKRAFNRARSDLNGRGVLIIEGNMNRITIPDQRRPLIPREFNIAIAGIYSGDIGDMLGTVPRRPDGEGQGHPPLGDVPLSPSLPQ